jgi:hypothetical protein
MKQLKFVLVAMNFALLAVLAMLFLQHSELRSTNIQSFVEAHHETAKMLLDCYIPGGGYTLLGPEHI